MPLKNQMDYNILHSLPLSQEKFKANINYHDLLLLLMFCWFQNTIVTVPGYISYVWREIISPTLLYCPLGASVDIEICQIVMVSLQTVK